MRVDPQKVLFNELAIITNVVKIGQTKTALPDCAVFARVIRQCPSGGTLREIDYTTFSTGDVFQELLYKLAHGQVERRTRRLYKTIAQRELSGKRRVASVVSAANLDAYCL
jgi:hypothetical protein